MKVKNPNNLPTAPMSEFVPTQGDLKFLSKDNYHKLKKAILKSGFDIPVYVWVDEGGSKHLLDGHQRRHLLTTEGWDEPIPYLVVKAASLEEAASRLLEITSQYGTITQEGLDEYLAKFELPEMEVRELTNFDAIFEFPTDITPEVEPEQEKPEEYYEPVSVPGVTYALGPHRMKCGNPKEGEVPPEKVDAYRKKYHRVMTGSEQGWEDGTPDTSEEFQGPL